MTRNTKKILFVGPLAGRENKLHFVETSSNRKCQTPDDVIGLKKRHASRNSESKYKQKTYLNKKSY